MASYLQRQAVYLSKLLWSSFFSNPTSKIGANQSTEPEPAAPPQVSDKNIQTSIEIEVEAKTAEEVQKIGANQSTKPAPPQVSDEKIQTNIEIETKETAKKKRELIRDFATLIGKLNEGTLTADQAKNDVVALINQGLPLNEKLYCNDKIIATPLVCALYSRYECIGIVELLCEAGTDPSLECHKNISGRMPIEQAVYQNFSGNIKSLLEAGSRLKRNIVTQESLNLAIKRDRKVIIRLLINHIYTNEKSFTITPQTLLFCGIVCESWAPIQRAIEQAKREGQDVATLLNSEFLDVAPINKATNTGNESIIKYLIEQGAKVNFDKTTDGDDLPFKVAIKKGIPEIIKTFLDTLSDQKSIDENKDAQEQTPLFWALQYKPVDPKLITSILEKKANINHQDINGKTPLTLAIELGCPIDIINLLIDHGAVLNYKYKNGNKILSPLSLAMDYNNIDAFLTIVNNQKQIVDVNVTGKTGISPLSFALQQLMVSGTTITTDTVKTLLKRKANVNTTVQGSPLLIWLAQNLFKTPHIREIFSNVLIDANNEIEIDCTDNNGYTPLMVLIDSSIQSPENLDLELIQSIINAKANVDYPHKKNGTTPLMVAIDAICSIDATADMEKTCIQVIELLIKNNVKVNQPDKDTKTPLMKAVETGRTEVVKFLIKNHANLEDHDVNGNTSLALAVLKRDLKMATLLVEQQADIKACNSNGHTPLALAVLTGNLDMATLLIEQQADIEACDSNGNTPLALAVLNKNNEMITFLIEHGAKIDITILDTSKSKRFPIFEYIRKTDVSILALLLQNLRIDQNLLIDSKNRTPFQWAIDIGNTEILGACLRNNPDIVNGYDENGYTPIMRALRALNAAGNKKDDGQKLYHEIIQLLLINGASISKESNCNSPNTPLTYALKTDNPDIVKLLFEKGLEYPDQVDGRTLLEFTIEKGHLKVATSLLSDSDIKNLDIFKFILTQALKDKRNEEYRELITNFVEAGGEIHLQCEESFNELCKIINDKKRGYSDGGDPLIMHLQKLKRAVLEKRKGMRI